MTVEDVHDIFTSWAKYPPAHLALHRLEQLKRIELGLPTSSPDAAPSAAPGPVDEAHVLSWVAAANGRG